MKIDAVSQVTNLTSKPLGRTEEEQTSFGNILNDLIDNVQQAETDNASDTLRLLTGETDDLHTSMIAMEKADIALQFTMQIRNKLLDAYNEIMHMQI